MIPGTPSFKSLSTKSDKFNTGEYLPELKLHIVNHVDEHWNTCFLGSQLAVLLKELGILLS